MRRASFSSTVNKELNRSDLFDCTQAFIVFSNNIEHSLIQLAVQKLGVGTFLGTKCCVVFIRKTLKLIDLGLAKDSGSNFLRV